MGYRTYLTLAVEIEPQTIGYFTKCRTEAFILDGYCF